MLLDRLAHHEGKQASEENSVRVTSDTLAVKQPIWMADDSGYDTLSWHDRLLIPIIVLAILHNA